MERKDFLKGGLGFLGIGAVIDGCKKDAAVNASSSASVNTKRDAARCIITPTEAEGHFLIPAGKYIIR